MVLGGLVSNFSKWDIILDTCTSSDTFLEVIKLIKLLKNSRFMFW